MASEKTSKAHWALWVIVAALAWRTISLGSEIDSLRSYVQNTDDLARRAMNRAAAAESAAEQAGQR